MIFTGFFILNKIVVIAGNQRYRAAKKLKLSEVPTVLYNDLTEEQEKDIILRDNHFYVDDYRFDAIWKDPAKVLKSGVKALVEPNCSLYDTTPIAYGLHQIYKKRWIARYFQECGILIYADLNVSIKANA